MQLNRLGFRLPLSQLSARWVEMQLLLILLVLKLAKAKPAFISLFFHLFIFSSVPLLSIKLIICTILLPIVGL